MKTILSWLFTAFLSTLISASCFAQQATGYIHVEQIDGGWWFVNGDGCLGFANYNARKLEGDQCSEFLSHFEQGFVATSFAGRQSRWTNVSAY